MLFKIYAKSEFFQNSCMKRDQNYLLNTDCTVKMQVVI